MDEDDFLKGLKKTGRYDSGFGEVPATDVVRATKGEEKDSRKAGKYFRRTVTLTEGQIEMVRRWAEELDLSQYAVYRWLIDRGLTALVEGERPETGYSVTPKEW